MEAKVIKIKKEFKPLTIEVKFETESEINNMIDLLSATNFEIRCSSYEDINNEVFPNFRPLRDKLTNFVNNEY